MNRAQIHRLPKVEELLIEGDLAEAFEGRESLRRELDIKRRQVDLLEIRAPARGTVVNWQVRQNLLRRPVQRGQNLMTIVDPDTHWVLELELPERRVAHLMRAMARSDEALDVTFTLASHPGQEFKGQLVEVDRQLDVRTDDGNAALVRVAFDETQIPADLLRSGTRVTAKVHSGHRSIGFVLFHELIETVQSSVMFWF